MAVPGGKSGDMSLRGDDGTRKPPRKPYVMQRPRETWTEREHQLFVEALSMFTRDWKKIQNHIGSKTAVQIRSHAQKYFQKQVKEGNGASVPPPRAKRQPGTVSRSALRRRTASKAGSDCEPEWRSGGGSRRVSAAADGSSCAAAPSDVDHGSASCDDTQSIRRAPSGAALPPRPTRKSRRVGLSAAAQGAEEQQESDDFGSRDGEPNSRERQRTAAAQLTASDRDPRTSPRGAVGAGDAVVPHGPCSGSEAGVQQGSRPGSPAPSEAVSTQMETLMKACPSAYGSYCATSQCSPLVAYPQPQAYFGAPQQPYPTWQQVCNVDGMAAPPKDPPNYAVVYNFLGTLFDGSCPADHATMLDDMGPNTRETASLCLRNLLTNMQAPMWQQHVAPQY